MSSKYFAGNEKSAKKEAGREVLPTPNGPDHNRSWNGGPKMAADSQYNDSAPARNIPDQHWKSLGDLARALAEKAGAGK